MKNRKYINTLLRGGEWRGRQRLQNLVVHIVKAGVKLSVSTPRRHIEGAPEVHIHSFLTSTLDAGECPTARPSRFAREKEPHYSLNRSLDGPEASLEGSAGQKLSSP
jgi:hypothetical protein